MGLSRTKENTVGRNRSAGPARGEFGRLLPLIGVLAAIYVLMAGLSAIDFGPRFWAVSEWRLQLPIFLFKRSADGRIALNTLYQVQILEQSAYNIILGVGMTFVILTGGIDLSVGSLLALCNVVFAMTVLKGAGDPAAGAPGLGAFGVGAAACLMTGLFAGWINGAVTVWGRVQSFIVTLGMMMGASGLAFVFGKDTMYLPTPHGYEGARGLIPTGLSLISVAVGFFVLRYTRLGRYMYAVGGNLEASRLSGVPVDRVRITAFTISGLCAALAGIVYWARLQSGTYLAGGGYELYAIAAVVIGGTSLSGGEGSILGTLIGALIMAVLNNGLSTVGIDAENQKIIIGAVIVVAALYDSLRHRRR
jgi:ribose transport system permease protein